MGRSSFPRRIFLFCLLAIPPVPLITCLGASHSSFQQNADSSSMTSEVSLPVAKNAIFAELGGNGIALSLNYERFVIPNLAIRIGVGAGVYDFTIPFMVNWYQGSTAKELELGIGLVLLPVWSGSFGEQGSTLVALTVGLRHQPTAGGLMMRLSLTPFYDPSQNKYKVLWGGVSIGMAF